MSIATAIQAAQGKVAAAYSKCNDKGATMPQTQDLANLANTIDSIQQGGGGNWLIDVLSSYIQTGSHVEITPEQGAELAPVAARQYGFHSLFEFTNLRSVSLAGVTTIDKGDYAFNTCVEMTSISFPDLVSISAQGFLNSCRALTTLSFPELTTVGTNSLREAFAGCWALASISFPKLTTGGAETAFWNAFDTCVALRTIEIHPASLSNPGVYYNPLVSATMITNLVLSQPATNDVYMTWCANLSTDSILGILNKLDGTATGKTCAFPTKTIASSDPNYAAISAKIAELTNWTITGLTL